MPWIRLTTPRVAVIIPLYNGTAWLGETLSSIRAQTLKPAEIIVVDDGSTDRPDHIIGLQHGVQKISNVGKGVSLARRLGQSESKSSILAFLDQDDLWHPDHLRLCVSALRFRPEAGAVIAGVTPFEDGTYPQLDKPRLHLASIDPWRLFPRTATTTPSGVVIQRRALDEVGGWTPHFGPAGDFHMWLRLSTQSPLIANKCVTVGHRRHSSADSWTLLCSNLQSYLDEEENAGMAAIEYRRLFFPDEEESLARKRDVIQALVALVRGCVEQDKELITRAGIQLERGVTSEPAERILNTLAMFHYFVEGQVRDPFNSRRSLVEYLLRHWPASARNTRKLIKASISFQPPRFHLRN